MKRPLISAVLCCLCPRRQQRRGSGDAGGGGGGEVAVTEPICSRERCTSGVAAALSGAEGSGEQRGGPPQPFLLCSHPLPLRVA